MATGFDGYLYYNNTGGTDASPDLVLIDSVRDVSTSVSADKADVSDRRSKFKKSTPAMLDIETTVTCTYIPGDTALEFIRNAFLARTPVQFYVLDGIAPPASGDTTEGYAYYASIYSNDFAQPLSEGETVSFSFSPTNPLASQESGDVEPQWYTDTTA